MTFALLFNSVLLLVIAVSYTHLDVYKRQLRGWIRNNKELYDAMYSGGEGKNDQAYSSRQVRLIVKFLDEP